MNITRRAPLATPTGTIAACAMLLWAVILSNPTHAGVPRRSPGMGMADLPDIDADRRASAHDDATRATARITATVVRADGTPVEGAVVITSAGGQGVTDAGGVAVFDVAVDDSAEDLNLTAGAVEGGVNLLGNVGVCGIRRGGEMPAGTIVLESSGACQPQWLPTFGSQPGVDFTMRALTVFDDGSGGGPALYAGGSFMSAGRVSVNYIAKWDGSSWSPLGSGMNAPGVTILAVFDDGSGGGPALYAGGSFTSAGGVSANYIAKWDGSSWSPLGGGTNQPVRALTVFDDGSGSGPALYAGGSFTAAGGLTANRIAKWDGSSWSALGSGMGVGGLTSVKALTVFDDGSGAGPALYAGGRFTTAGGLSANYTAKWDGSSWSALGSGMSGSFPRVYALTVFDDGSGGGPALFAGGQFTTAGGASANYIAKWDGSSWSPLGSGVNNSVSVLTVFDDGSGRGPALYAGGQFTTAGGVSANRIAKWDGSSWSALGSGMNGSVYPLTVFDDGSRGGLALYAGGYFTTAGGVSANRIAKWDGSSWSAMGSGMNNWVYALRVFDDGSGGGPALYAGGGFTSTGAVGANYIAKWDGSSWSPLGSGTDSFVYALTVFDAGSRGGLALYAGGQFTTTGGVSANRIAKWDGSSWSPLGRGMNSYVLALTVFDDGSGGGPALFAGGLFTSAGGVSANRIAKWDGSSWSALGTGVDNWVYVLTVFDDGSGGGPALYAGGEFTSAGGVSANYIAKWDGLAWSSLGSGMNSFVFPLTAFDDGSGRGPALYAGGGFTSAGGVSANYIARWDGTTWSALGSGTNDQVVGLTVFDDGSGAGPALYAGGRFTTAGCASANRVAKWDGSAWSPLGGGTNDQVVGLTVFDDGSGAGPALYAGGLFTISPAGDSYLARWQGCPIEPAIPGDVNGDGVVNELDLMELLPCFGLPALPPDCAQGEDVNGDGVVNVLDLIELLLNFGATAP